ncbi:MAG TPA: cytochrome C oxidase subunit IV family protein [Steroidobacteraceae bacterium]|jgi:caa(3)-type oxidase subunit IV
MKVTSIQTLLATWGGLLLLLALTTASAYVHLGLGNLLLNLGIAAIKVALIAAIFMHLVRSSVTVRLAASAALFFLFILAFLFFGDWLTRPSNPAPWRAPPSDAR